MDLLCPSQYDGNKENIPPLSPKHPNPLPATRPSKALGSKRARKPLEDITHLFRPSGISTSQLNSASGSGSLPLLICSSDSQSDPRRPSADIDIASSGLSRAIPRKRKVVDDRNARQRSCRMSLRKELR